MRKRSLLAAGMLTVLLATSACGAVTGATNSPTQPSGPPNTGPEASFIAGYDISSDEVGTTQRAAAAAAARKAGEAGAAGAAFVAARKTAARVQAAGRNPVAAAARAVAPKLALKPATAPLLPVLSGGQTDNAADATVHTRHDNQPVGPEAVGHGEQHKNVTGAGTDEDPVTGDPGHCPATGEDVDSPAGTRSDDANARRDFNVEDDSDDCNDSQGGTCHRSVKENRKNHSD
ncbi:hypothetical protein [Pseudarthrobacter sulfonivorans]|uniref:hypothetical protein n=1 Tax=Pseudarthrobacter sulfonivorans TaxID=121292 RepID=UPI0028676AD6|nr:hypothetical protein [Pseudarthrobacter sulfonivorans]MDR6415944.1 hypothetical protein [Pseudarthrobacter sulfonivorans]